MPGPSGTQTVKVRSRSLVSVKPKEFLRLRVIVDPHGPVVYLSGLHYAWNIPGVQLAARVLGVEAAHLTSLTLNGNALPVQAGDFLLDVTLAEGVNAFTLLPPTTKACPARPRRMCCSTRSRRSSPLPRPHPEPPSRSAG